MSSGSEDEEESPAEDWFSDEEEEDVSQASVESVESDASQVSNSSVKKSPIEAKQTKKTTTSKKTTTAAKKPPKKATKAKTASIEESHEIILQYLTQQNRPYSHVQVFDNLHGQVKKTLVPKVLAELAEQGSIFEKTFKKTKLYNISQDSFETMSKDDMEHLDCKIINLSSQVNNIKSIVHSLQVDINRLETQPDDNKLDQLLLETRNIIKNNDEKLASYLATQGNVDENALSKLQEGYNNNFKIWRKRKRAEDEMISTYAENVTKKPNKIREELGIETDEDVQIDFNRYKELYSN